VTNTGSRAGTETAQTYLGFPSKAGEPPAQLKGMAKVTLQPQQSKRVNFTLDQRAFSIWDTASQTYGPVSGDYQVAVGDSSRNLPLHATVNVGKVIGFQSVTTKAPAIVTPGQATTVGTTFTNNGDFPVSQVALTATAPAGWSVAGGATRQVGMVPAHGTATATWQVSVPASAPPGSNDITVSATLRNLTGDVVTRTSTATVTVPYASAAAAFNNSGISDDGAPASAAFTSSLRSYSAQAVAAAGLPQGGTVSQAGQTFSWPATTGKPDNVAATGQIIGMAGSGSNLGFLGAAVNATQTGTGTVYYTDGTSSSYTLSLDNWWNTAPTVADTAVATASYQNSSTGRYDHPATVWFAQVAVDPAKTVSAVVLPNSGSTMHIFGMSLH
jgi:beta-glucosidase